MPDQSPTNDPMAAFGPNEWLVDELYEQYQNDRNSVDKAWWSFFEDYHPNGGGETSNGSGSNGVAPAPTATASRTAPPALRPAAPVAPPVAPA
ncbi:MAG TPA: hypothetical protein VGN19_09060, partial [Pedococcus sp.]|nr:hypothetical protein [Pedococcus sp.]